MQMSSEWLDFRITCVSCGRKHTITLAACGHVFVDEYGNEWCDLCTDWEEAAAVLYSAPEEYQEAYEKVLKSKWIPTDSSTNTDKGTNMKITSTEFKNTDQAKRLMIDAEVALDQVSVKVQDCTAEGDYHIEVIYVPLPELLKMISAVSNGRLSYKYTRETR